MRNPLKPVLRPGPTHPISVTPTEGLVTVVAGGREVAGSSETLTLAEAALPPVPYVPLGHVEPDVLLPSDHTTYCPYKGEATYYHLKVDDVLLENAAWSYQEPHDAVAPIAGHVAFDRRRVDRVELAAVG